MDESRAALGGVRRDTPDVDLGIQDDDEDEEFAAEVTAAVHKGKRPAPGAGGASSSAAAAGPAAASKVVFGHVVGNMTSTAKPISAFRKGASAPAHAHHAQLPPQAPRGHVGLAPLLEVEAGARQLGQGGGVDGWGLSRRPGAEDEEEDLLEDNYEVFVDGLVQRGLDLPTVIDKILAAPKSVLADGQLKKKMAEIRMAKRESDWNSDITRDKVDLSQYNAAEDPHCWVLEDRRKFNYMAEKEVLEPRHAVKLMQRIEKRERAQRVIAAHSLELRPERKRFDGHVVPVDWAVVYERILMERQSAAFADPPADEPRGDVAKACERTAARLEASWDLLCVPELHRREFRARHMRAATAANYAALLSQVTLMIFARKHVEGIVELLHRRAEIMSTLMEVLAARDREDGRVDANVDELRTEVLGLGEVIEFEVSKWREMLPWNRDFVYQGKEVVSQIKKEEKRLKPWETFKTQVLPERTPSQLSYVPSDRGDSRPASAFSMQQGQQQQQYYRPPSSLLAQQQQQQQQQQQAASLGGMAPPPEATYGAAFAQRYLGLRHARGARGGVVPRRAETRAEEAPFESFPVLNRPVSASSQATDALGPVDYRHLAHGAAERAIQSIRRLTKGVVQGSKS
jgi:hypothetical protein